MSKTAEPRVWVCPTLRGTRWEAPSAWLGTQGVRVWRDVRERQNGVTDAAGRRVHVKRLRPGGEQAADEVAGLARLHAAGIPAAELAAHGVGSGPDGRDGWQFVATFDLAGLVPADRLLRRHFYVSSAGEPEATPAWRCLRDATAGLTARLHAAGLHHRDLYPCHFLARPDAMPDVHLIDAARVGRLPRRMPIVGGLLARRWVVKDLAQFVHGLARAGAPPDAAEDWLAAYEAAGGRTGLRRAVRRKAARIARHDARLRRRQPGRDVSWSSAGGKEPVDAGGAGVT